MGEIRGRNQNDKNGYHHRGDSNTHPKHMILWTDYDNQVKNTGFL